MYCLELAGEDDAFAAREAEAAAAGVEILAPGLARAGHVDRDRLRGLAYTHAADELVARSAASVDAAATALDAAAIDREGTVAVRARDVRGLTGVSTSDAERRLGGVLVDRGFAVDLDDPDHELRALFSAEDGLDDPDSDATAAEQGQVPAGDGVCVLGWLDCESERDFGERRPTDRPFFQPGSMAPMDARALVNIAGAASGRRILDPMCGTGGTLLEAGLVGADLLGTDAQWKMVRGTRENLEALVEGVDTAVARADATALPLREDVVDGVVFDAPYGRQSKIATHRLEDLVEGALAEAARVSSGSVTCVLMADRDWREAVSATEWRVTDRFERRVHGSLTRHVHVLEKQLDDR
ncbi:methyltransferase domain-containing protein [Halolamina sp. CBA1230]|uniref:methyltransferase domain-containing protein n=1 Tax=Halolamina sp. CBA1230 TaxID=1853690 RepID=UPI0009A1DF58|nr:methyltransferase domain-containing protein [Halolamina sp. CBA1230]QKY20804.1 methyltransferase domain-containing protein [Halolamina sp. CBA1230]